MFGRKKEEQFLEDTNDILIVFDDEKKTSDIRNISYIQDGAVKVVGVNGYSIPYDDCEITNSPEGRNFFYRAPTQSIKETQRLAQLEKNIVLTQITQYRPREVEQRGNGLTFALVGVIVFAFLMFAVSGCTSG